MEVFKAIVNVLVGLSTFIGMLVFGVSLGWLILDAYKKSDKPWQIQLAFLVGFFGFLIALAAFVHVALAGFGLGFGMAIFMWGLPKKPDAEE